MAISLGNVQSGSGTGSVVVTKPTGLVTGDLMIAHIHSDIAGLTVSAAPSNWTQIPSSPQANQTAGRIYWKIATGSEAANYTWTMSANSAVNGTIFAMSGAHPTAPIAADNGTNTTTTNPLTVSTITPSANSGIIIFGGQSRNTGGTPSASGYSVVTSNPGAWTEIYDVAASGSDGYAAGWAIRPETTGTGNGSITFAGAGSQLHAYAFMVAVAPGVNVTGTQSSVLAMTLFNPIKFAVQLLTATLSLLAASVPSWSTKGKSSSSWTNQDQS